jgi:hypothetical protein
MPPKIRELVAALESAGFIDRGGKGTIVTMFIPRLSNRLRFLVIWEMMQSTIRSELYNEQSRSQRDEREC